MVLDKLRLALIDSAAVILLGIGLSLAYQITRWISNKNRVLFLRGFIFQRDRWFLVSSWDFVKTEIKNTVP
jgi:hypothetical protein